jgi:hypothetical protein
MTTKKPRKKSAKMNVKIITEISIEELDRLREDYGIEPGDYFRLALRLAIDYVPGFPKFKLQHGDYGKVMRDKGGRPTDWTPEKRDELRADVDRVKKKYGFATDDEALKHLTKSGKWARQPGRDPDKWRKTLKNALGHARSDQRVINPVINRLDAEADRLATKLSSNPEN